MDWIKHYQLFLFDFDGLLVNTENIHHQAYQKMCEDRGFTLPWNFHRYCLAAHKDATALRDQIYEELPGLKELEPNWDILYAEKKQAIIDLIYAGKVELMPGVEELLLALEEANIKRCVVTHSASELVDGIRKQQSVLNTIPHWFTREYYSKPKPDPECYIKAIDTLGEEGDKVIGFEDMPRGLQALLGTSAQAVLICPPDYPGIEDMTSKEGVLYFNSFKELSLESLGISQKSKS